MFVVGVLVSVGSIWFHVIRGYLVLWFWLGLYKFIFGVFVVYSLLCIFIYVVD